MVRRVRTEALDCLVYAWAPRSIVAVHFDDRASTLEGVPPAANVGRVSFVDAW